MEELIRKYAIQNKIKFGTASEKTVLGRVLSEKPELKTHLSELQETIRKEVAVVNETPPEELEKGGVTTQKRTEKRGITLPGNPKKVVMRFAPNPNGPPTLGHARGIVINSELVKKYDGKLILRFDDTDPKTKRPLLEAYGWYLDDCRWLGFNPDEVVECSSRIPEYYKYAEKLIILEKAYVCKCAKDAFKAYRDGGRPCPDRDKTADENLKDWSKMLSGGYEEGDAVLRIKTELKSPDPALRDWVAFRIVKTEHPKVGSKHVVWPMLDFAGAMEDYLLGVTHIIRGKDLMDSGRRQNYVYEYLGWKYPEVMHWGRIRVIDKGDAQDEEVEEEGDNADRVIDITQHSNLAALELESETHCVTITKLSTSGMARAIKEGAYTGWDDPRLHTIMALRRRGITPEAIRNMMLSLGLSEHDISVSMETLYAENRKILDPKVNRYFFVEDPVEVVVERPQLKTVRIPLHPSFKERGLREQTLKTDDRGNARIFISRKDAKLLEKECTVKLIGLPCIRKTGAEKKFLKASCFAEKDAGAQKIHWVQDYVKAEVVMNDRPADQPKTGYCEPACRSISVGEVVQFERFGFCRLDKKTDEKLTFFFTHD